MLSAQALRLGLQEGCFDRGDVQTWIAEQVDALDPLPPGLLDLIPLTALDDAEIDALLGGLAIAISRADEARIRIDVVADALQRGRIGLREAARRFERIAITDFDALPRDLASAAAALDDGIYLAESGTYGTLPEAEQAVRDFVAMFARPLS